AVLGLTFKPETDDMREAPAIPILHRLFEAGARLQLFDPAGMDAARPLLPDANVTWCTSALDAADGADALVVLTEWNEFRAITPARLRERMRGTTVVDLRNIWDPDGMREEGLRYRSLGRSGPPRPVSIANVA
ncbi:MAG: UDP-glucose 6-dehydrogenase, partial [Gluconacetobacter diazotrophicus]|nr:UDP-glucose 6-dehydrogenase [Gluconacetobacter diazotrophicus]